MHGIYSRRPREARRQLPLSKGRPYSTKADSNAARKSKRSQHLRLTADGIGNACHGATGSDGRCTRDIHFRSRQEDNYIFLMQNKKKTTSQREARSYEVVPSALVYSKSGGASERAVVCHWGCGSPVLPSYDRAHGLQRSITTTSCNQSSI
jgi:hypothetical protein